jgi:uncharacterized protein YwgA
MRKRFKRLRNLLEALEIDLTRSCTDTREEVQAGVFLAQLLRQENEYDGADVTRQVGYHFGWYDGPFSAKLEEDHCELVDHLRFEQGTNGVPLDEHATPLESYAESVIQHADASTTGETDAEWLRTLAAVAYLRAGADWDEEGAKQELKSALGGEVVEWFRTAEAQLAEMGLLNPNEQLT